MTLSSPIPLLSAPLPEQASSGTRAVVVTGAGGPAGVAVVRRLTALGHRVVAVDADPAAAVLVTEGHEDAVYELGGAPFTMQELAAAVSAATGRTVTYTDVPVEQYQQILIGAGLPEAAAAVFADGDRGVADGELLVEGNDLDKLIGRAPTSLADALARV